MLIYLKRNIDITIKNEIGDIALLYAKSNIPYHLENHCNRCVEFEFKLLYYAIGTR